MQLGNYEPKKIEPEILDFWAKNNIYLKAKAKVKKGEDFYFLDGPPYTSGEVHIGTAWNKVLKDCVLRFKRMAGFNVWDRAGYDMHGLPVEHKVEAKFGIKHKDEIPKFGVDKFVTECQNFALQNLALMNRDFKRLGVWMDFDNAYQSIKPEFIEGVWWLIAQAAKNGRLYEGERVMHWCPRCETALAKHELDYKTISDDSIFLKFPVKGKRDEYLIIWTTTPWTIPFNLGVMANPDLDYVRADVGGEVWILAKALAAAMIQGVADRKFKILEEFKGKKLEGLAYVHPLYGSLKRVYDDLKKKAPKIHTVVMSSEYVDVSAGSGLVHMAPGCGPEDYEVGHRNNIPPFNLLDEEGKFPEEMKPFAGFTARMDDKKFIASLEKTGYLVATTKVEHEYAHCWRCHNPVIFRTTSQWFFKVEDLLPKMRELNKKVFWQPDWAGNRWFDSWLENLRDNSITRQRYWGTPLPIWRCEKCGDVTVIGSLKELKKYAKVPANLHRPWIDAVEFRCKKCEGMKRRISDILDVWIDAGTTSWTCLDFPQNMRTFKKLWPAAFILEGKDQIRGWFNLLLVCSMVAFAKHPYKAVYMHGFVNDSQGRKMSKSLGNVISPYEVIDNYGADVFRYYVIGGANPGIDLNYNFEDMKVKYRNLVVLWNVHKLVIESAREFGKNPTEILLQSVKENFEAEEQYILSRLNSTIADVTEMFKTYRINEVPLAIESLFLDLSRTYIQLVRDKLALGAEKEKEAVLYCMYNVLLECLKIFAPIAPMVVESMYLNFKEAFGLKHESIHLFDWPEYDKKAIDKALENEVAIISNITQAILSAREKTRLGLKWPLKEAIIVTKDEETATAVKELSEILKRQTNIKEIKLQEEEFRGIKQRVKADYEKLERLFGTKKAAKIIAHIATVSPETVLGHIESEGKYVVDIEKEKIELLREHLLVEREVPRPYEEVRFGKGIAYINYELTPELEAEGFAREVMRRVQALRKKAGLEKTDRIQLHLQTDEDLREMLVPWESVIKEKVGAEKIKISELAPAKKHAFVSKEKVKDKEFEVAFDRI